MTAARILVIGRSGQVATALRRAAWPNGYSVQAFGRADGVDIGDRETVSSLVAKERWAAVVNAAAYTAVDRAEEETEEAYRINRDGTANLAAACARSGLPLVHLSTDYVFDGRKADPYGKDDPVNPVSVYGASKAAGEHGVRNLLPQHVILRTAWVFSDTGSNFVRTMLRLGKERDELRIVDDQWGRPTAASSIADAVKKVVTEILRGKTDGFGTWHFADGPPTTWYRFAREIFAQASERGYGAPPRLVPIPSSAFPTRANRPMNSVLYSRDFESAFGIKTRDWKSALADVLDARLGKVMESTASQGGRRA